MSDHILSPELALVDPELAAHARSRLPDPSDCLRPRYAESVAPSSMDGSPAQSEQEPATVAAPQLRPSLVVVLAALLVALIVGSPALDLLPSSRSMPTLLGASTPAASSQPSPERAPQAGRKVTPARSEPLTTGARSGPSMRAPEPTRPIVLEWSEAPGAAFYNVVLWRQGKRVLDVWPSTNRLTIPADREVEGRVIAPGSYQWFAFAAFRRGEQTRFGELIERGEIIVRD